VLLEISHGFVCIIMMLFHIATLHYSAQVCKLVFFLFYSVVSVKK